ncbi:ubiquinol oxidase subunit II [Roseomonas sp. HJA6]|uniref:Ubiquinol oxidase polypeptide II n=2 Tax=Roseomonas alba TaxID=2846776 RepID=A0ABS7AHV4_9PROT|nr:ubiquinol oxidase subunit II [Neoroseomonas alba]
MRRTVRRLALLAVPLLLGGCNLVVLNPAGDVAQRQGDLVMIATGLMLLIILPVMALTVLFAWRYRAAHRDAPYDPDWDHSTGLELVIWAAPLVIIICLGALTWAGTHLLDPYRPLARIAPDRPVPASVEPLEVNVVALDWKWLFILPEYGIASVNELAAPVDRPIRFRITATSVMNSFYIPALAGQIYAMPGMETTLNAVINRPGEFEGFSANYSGAGFSGMRFRFHGMTEQGFEGWVAQVRRAGETLGRTDFLALQRPSQNAPVRHFSAVDPDLFSAILNMCVEPGRMCQHDMMSIDARGGLGVAGIGSVRRLVRGGAADDGAERPAGSMVASICAIPTFPAARPERAAVSQMRLTGAGLRPPGLERSLPLAVSQLPPGPES